MEHLLVFLGRGGAAVASAWRSRQPDAGVPAGRVAAVGLDVAPGPATALSSGAGLTLQADANELQALLAVRDDLRQPWVDERNPGGWMPAWQQAWDAFLAAGPTGWPAASRALTRSLLALRQVEVLALLHQALQALQVPDPTASAPVDEATDPGLSTTTCHVVVDLGDPVGAGLLVDLLALLRLNLPPGAAVHLHASLPDGERVDGSTAQDLAQAAVLMQELALLAEGRGWPVRLADGSPSEMLAQTPAFERCWLVGDGDEQGLPRRDVAARATASANLLHDLIERPAALSPLRAEGDGLAAARFVAWGQAQVRCDLGAIGRHLAHELLLRLLNQLRYDHWRPALGYVASASTAERELRLDEAQLEDWGLGPAHLAGQTGMAEIGLADEAPGAIEREWQALAEHALGLVELTPAESRAAQLAQLMALAERERFRGVGVQAAFEPAGEALQRRAVAVRQRVERTLWLDWRDERRSLHGCGQLLALVLAHVARESARLDALRQEREGQALGVGQQAEALIPASGGGLWRRWGAAAQASPEQLQPLAYLLRDAALARTHATRLAASVRLCEALQQQLTVLLGMVDDSEAELGRLSQQVDQIAAACLPPNGAAVLPGVPGLTAASPGADDLPPLRAGQRLDSRELIALHRQRLVNEPGVLREHLAAVRPAAFAHWAARWGERAGFRMLAPWWREVDPVEVLRQLCDTRVRPADLDDVAADAWAAVGRRWRQDAGRRERDLRGLLSQAPLGLTSVDAGAVRLQTGWSLPVALVQATLVQAATALATDNPHDGSAARPVDGEAPAPVSAERLAALVPDAGPDVRLALDRRPVLTLWRLGTLAELSGWRQLAGLQLGLEGWHQRHGSAARWLRLDPVAGAALPVVRDPARVMQRARVAVLLAEALGLVEVAPTRVTHVRRDADGFEIDRSALGASLFEAVVVHAELLAGGLHDGVLDRLREQPPSADEVLRCRESMQRRIEALRRAAEVVKAVAREVAHEVAQEVTHGVVPGTVPPAGPAAADPTTATPDEQMRPWHDAARQAMKILRQEPTSP